MLPHSWIEPQVMWKVQFLGFFLNKTPLFAQKDHFLRCFLNSPPPQNPYWKIEPRGSIRADTVVYVLQRSITLLALAGSMALAGSRMRVWLKMNSLKTCYLQILVSFTGAKPWFILAGHCIINFWKSWNWF